MTPTDERAALITGGSRGIGLAIAKLFLARGMRVVVTSRSEDGAAEAEAQLGAGASAFVAHAGDEEAAAACVEFTLERCGALDVLINNAGTNPAYGPLVDVERSRFMKTIEVNLWAPIMWSGLAWRAAMRERGGTIVNVSSVGGMTVEPELGVYNATKAALMHVTRQLATELAPQVRVNAVAPGVVRTRLAEALWAHHEAEVAAETPLARIGEPDDVARAVGFLVDSDSAFITGEALVLDGGRHLGQSVYTTPSASSA